MVVTYGFGTGIVQLAAQHRLPAIYPARGYVDIGGLMAYGSDRAETARQCANDVHQILGGIKPGEIPIYQATKFELVINLKTANSLGLYLNCCSPAPTNHRMSQGKLPYAPPMTVSHSTLSLL